MNIRTLVAIQFCILFILSTSAGSFIFDQVFMKNDIFYFKAKYICKDTFYELKESGIRELTLVNATPSIFVIIFNF